MEVLALQLLFFKQNATKALAHAAKIRGKDIAICKGIIPIRMATAYVKLEASRSSLKQKKRRLSDLSEVALQDVQRSVAVDLIAGGNRRGTIEAHNGSLLTTAMLWCMLIPRRWNSGAVETVMAGV